MGANYARMPAAAAHLPWAIASATVSHGALPGADPPELTVSNGRNLPQEEDMQLWFGIDEYELLANLLMQRDRELREELARTDAREFKAGLQQELQRLNGLENRVLARHLQLGAEELDFLAEVMNHCYRELVREIAGTDRREFRTFLFSAWNNIGSKLGF